MLVNKDECVILPDKRRRRMCGSARAHLPQSTSEHKEVREAGLPYQRDIFPGHLFEVTNGCGLPCKAVIGVVVSHNGGGSQLAQFILGAL